VLENKDYRLIVKTLYGLEEILSKELLSLGGREIQKLNRAVAVVGDLGFVYKINIALRTGLRVLLPLNEIQMETVDDYYDAVYEIPWEDLFDEGISRENVRIYLDTSGESLHRRGYRLEAAKAPLNEVLAAGIILHSSWNGGMPVLDPMCGSGTFLVEAALIAHNMPANIYRESFAFFNWKGFEEELFVKIREGLLSRAKDYEGKFFGRDIDVYSLDAAAANIERSMFEDAVRLKRADFFEADPPAEKGLLLINPPYNVRIQADTHQMYRQIGDTLKEKYAGWQVFWITSDMEAIKSIGLRPSRKWNLFNGELECKLLRFDMYEGTKKLHKLNR